MTTKQAKKIFINNKDLGFWTQEEVTVQRFETVYLDDDTFEEEKLLVYCNHAGSEEVEEETLSGHNIDVRYCDKCPASRLVGDNQWLDAPVEGEHDEQNR